MRHPHSWFAVASGLRTRRENLKAQCGLVRVGSELRTAYIVESIAWEFGAISRHVMEDGFATEDTSTQFVGHEEMISV